MCTLYTLTHDHCTEGFKGGTLTRNYGTGGLRGEGGFILSCVLYTLIIMIPRGLRKAYSRNYGTEGFEGGNRN